MLARPFLPRMDRASFPASFPVHISGVSGQAEIIRRGVGRMATFFLHCLPLWWGSFAGVPAWEASSSSPLLLSSPHWVCIRRWRPRCFPFALMAVLGTWLHHRKGSIDWMQAIPLCFGAFLFGFIGAKANMYLSPVWLKYILAVQIIFAGLNVLRPLQKSCFNVTTCPMNVQRLALFLLGGFAGFRPGLPASAGPSFPFPS